MVISDQLGFFPDPCRWLFCFVLWICFESVGQSDKKNYLKCYMWCWFPPYTIGLTWRWRGSTLLWAFILFIHSFFFTCCTTTKYIQQWNYCIIILEWDRGHTFYLHCEHSLNEKHIIFCTKTYSFHPSLIDSQISDIYT